MKINFLSGNMLKIIAAISMVIDHVGMLFFPKVAVFRIIGRLAFPLFAYMIAEGARYTKNKARYFLVMFLPAAVGQSIYALYDPKSLYYCILITFSLSVMMIYALQFFKKAVFEKAYLRIIGGACLFAASVWFVWHINTLVKIDYGFWGSMVPVFASLFQPVEKEDTSFLKKTDYTLLHVLTMTIGLLLLAENAGTMKVQLYSLWAVPLLCLYSGKRGKLNMKYFFYIFYPMHLAVLGIIYLWVK